MSKLFRARSLEDREMGWLYLALAILFEVAGTTSMKLSEGLTRLIPTISIVVFYLISFSFLSLSLKEVDLSVGYAIWSGAGLVLIAIISHILFNESFTFIKILSLVLIIIGIVGLKWIR